jgi:F-type H+-transporting ATPase subunit alpha
VPVEEQVIALYAVTNGYLDDVEVDRVRRFERELIDFVQARYGDVARHLREQGTLADIEDRLRQALDEFRPTFVAAA